MRGAIDELLATRRDQARYRLALYALEEACPATFAIWHTVREGEVSLGAMATQLGTDVARVSEIVETADLLVAALERDIHL